MVILTKPVSNGRSNYTLWRPLKFLNGTYQTRGGVCSRFLKNTPLLVRLSVKLNLDLLSYHVLAYNLNYMRHAQIVLMVSS